MNSSAFNPGFRLSVIDVFILIVGLIVSIVLGIQIWWAGMIIAFVVVHFFLFCNVFRMSRSPELIWAAGFVTLAASTIFTGIPGWIGSAIISIGLSSFLIWRETKKQGYHGICWKRWNAALPEWWESNKAK